MAKPVIFGCSGLALTSEEQDFFQAHNPVGFILFARNVESPEQVRQLVETMRRCTSYPTPFILIDQEGGRVARLGKPHWRTAPPAGDFAALAQHDLAHAKEAVYLNHRLLADDLHSLGINVDCAPMLDLRFPDCHDIVGDRAFGTDPEQVIALGREACRGLLDGSVLPVIKHIPGHGRAMADSHKALPIVNTSLDTLEQTDFKPFKALSSMPLAMTAHIHYTAIDPDYCATLSPRAIQLIREDIGFTGILMTDDLSMHALSGNFGNRTRQALQAGCDLILHCNGDMPEMEAIAEVLPAIDGELEQRLQTAYSALLPPAALNRQDVETKLQQLVA